MTHVNRERIIDQLRELMEQAPFDDGVTDAIGDAIAAIYRAKDPRVSYLVMTTEDGANPDTQAFADQETADIHFNWVTTDDGTAKEMWAVENTSTDDYYGLRNLARDWTSVRARRGGVGRLLRSEDAS